MTFGTNLSVSGSALRVYGFNTNRIATVRVPVSATVTAGTTVYSSFLFLFNNINAVPGARASLSLSGFAFASQPDGSALATPANSYSGASTTSGASAITTGVNYLLVSRFTNVGAAGGGTATTWVFNRAGYDAWISAGEQESDLSTHAIMAMSNSSTTQTNFASHLLLRIETGFAPSGESGRHEGVFDEVRYATTLHGALGREPIPEPASLALAMAGLALLGGRSRSGRTR